MNSKFSQVFESDVFSHLKSLKYMPRWVVLLVDLILCNISFWLACTLAVQFYSQQPHFEPLLPIWGTHVVVSLVCLLSFWAFHTYSGILRYSSFVDIAKLLFMVVSQSILLFILNEISSATLDHYMYMRAAIIVYCVLAFLALMLLRMGVKVSFDYLMSSASQVKHVAIYGTKSAGIGIAKMIRASDSLQYRLSAFVDDEKQSKNAKIFGVPIILKQHERSMLQFFAKHKIRTLIVSPLKMQSIDPDKDLEVFFNNGIEILVMPKMNEWHENAEVDTTVKHDFRNIQIEDLLNRKPIEIEKRHIADQVKNKVVMVTGAAGSIGSEIVRQLTHYKPSMLVLFDNAETPLHSLRLELEEMKSVCPYAICIGDMRNRQRLEDIIAQYRPNIIYHAAAYKHVPMMEEAPCECIIANVLGTRYIADLAVKYEVDRFVMVSTDKAVNPTNVMGASKRIAEIYVQSLYKRNVLLDAKTTKFVTTRFGNVLGSNGSVIPLFRHQIETGGPVTVTHPDIIRYFMTIPEACQLVLEAGSMGDGGEIFIFDMGRPVKIADLARKMIRLAGYRPDVDIPITYTGLRPGEKLYEELLNVKETTTKTYNEKILIAKTREYDFDAVSHEIDKLIEFARLYKNFMVVSQMKHIVPEYISKNSQYERLDIKVK